MCAQTFWMLSGKVVLSIDFHMNRVSLGEMLAEVTLVLRNLKESAVLYSGEIYFLPSFTLAI